MRNSIDICAFLAYDLFTMSQLFPEAKHVKVTVLLQPNEFNRFDTYCKEMGYKKSPLLARLIRDFLNNEGIDLQKPADAEYEKTE